jgi:transposase
LGVVEQTLHNCVKAERQGQLTGAEKKAVSADQREISRLRAELARVKMEHDILGKATACFAREQKRSTPLFDAIGVSGPSGFSAACWS